jgi:hypothetical protein
MVPSLKMHLLAKKGTLPGCSDVFATHPMVKVILWGCFGTKLAFEH